MESTFGLEIYASNKLAYAGRARSLVVPVEDGEKAFLAHHANVIVAIVPGELRYEDADGNKVVAAVSSGFVEMINNRAKLFLWKDRKKLIFAEHRRQRNMLRNSSVRSRAFRNTT